MKKAFFSVILMLCGIAAYSQGFVYTTDGKMFYAEAKNLKEETVTVEIGESFLRIPRPYIVLIEYMEGGIEYLQPDKVQAIEPKAFDGDYETFFAKGRKVYVPVSNTKIENRWGGKRLRELVFAEGYWQAVGCPEEADFILVYKFFDSGHDHAKLLIYDRTNALIMETTGVSASDWVPAHAGIESAEKLYKYQIKDLIQANDKKNIKRKKQGLFWKYPWEKKNTKE